MDQKHARRHRNSRRFDVLPGGPAAVADSGADDVYGDRLPGRACTDSFSATGASHRYPVSTPAGATILNTMYGFTRDATGVVTSYSVARTMHNGVNPSGDIADIYFDPNGPVNSYVIRKAY